MRYARTLLLYSYIAPDVMARNGTGSRTAATGIMCNTAHTPDSPLNTHSLRHTRGSRHTTDHQLKQALHGISPMQIARTHTRCEGALSQLSTGWDEGTQRLASPTLLSRIPFGHPQPFLTSIRNQYVLSKKGGGTVRRVAAKSNVVTLGGTSCVGERGE